MWRLAAILIAMTVPVLVACKQRNPCDVINLARGSGTRRGPDGRTPAAANGRRGSDADLDPQAARDVGRGVSPITDAAQPQYAAAGVAAVARPGRCHGRTGVGRRALGGRGERTVLVAGIRGSIRIGRSRHDTFVRTSWRMLAGIAVLVIVLWVARFAWPGMKDKTSLASSKQADKSQSAPAARATPDRPNAGETRSAVGAREWDGCRWSRVRPAPASRSTERIAG